MFFQVVHWWKSAYLSTHQLEYEGSISHMRAEGVSLSREYPSRALFRNKEDTLVIWRVLLSRSRLRRNRVSFFFA
jgi:hypothetical protein